MLYSEISNSTTAGFEFVNEETVKKLYPWSVELCPSPLVPNFLIFSTKTSSPTVNGAVENPRTGVAI